MLRYTPSISWTDGIFLRPHHFQQTQQALAQLRNSDRTLALPYPYGIAHLDIDATALEHLHLSITSLQAILPGGAEIDLPQNARVETLDLSPALSNASTLTIYLAIPPLRPGESNLSPAGSAGTPTRYEATPADCHDLNSGGNEHPIMFRQQRLLLATQADALPGYEKLPLMRLECHRSSDGRPTLTPDRNYIPPTLLLSAAPELGKRLQALCDHLDHIVINLITSLRERDLQLPQNASVRLEKMVKSAIIQSALAVLKQQAATPSTTPVALYSELCRLLMQLAAFRPLEDSPEPPLYEHSDSMPQFSAVLDAIYRLTSAEATEWCVRVELTRDNQAWTGELQEEWLGCVKAVYVGVRSHQPPRRVADHVEAGDVFKLTAASQANMRIRGVRLTEDRIPSPLLPPGSDRLWFCAMHPERDDTWQDIAEERRCALTWSPQILPDTEAELYLILSTPTQRS